MRTRDLALVVSLSALYTVFCIFPIFQIIGLPSKSITMAAILAPVIGVILGPYLGALSTIVGGLIGLLTGYFSHVSFVAGVAAAFCAGSLYFGRRDLCALTYFSLLLLFGFCPIVGPVWLYPPLMWLQILGFVILVSPVQSAAVKNVQKPKSSRSSFLGFFLTFLVSTLAGQIAGSLTFELTLWPLFTVDVNGVKLVWQTTVFLYPIERVVIALASTFIGVALHKALKSANVRLRVTGM
jgi:predicted membrane protein